jgi:hypothetical protein
MDLHEYYWVGIRTVSGISPAAIDVPADARTIVGVPTVAGISSAVDVPAEASILVACVPTVVGISATVDVPADAGTVVGVPTIAGISAAGVLLFAVYVYDVPLSLLLSTRLLPKLVSFCCCYCPWCCYVAVAGVIAACCWVFTVVDFLTDSDDPAAVNIMMFLLSLLLLLSCCYCLHYICWQASLLSIVLTVMLLLSFMLLLWAVMLLLSSSLLLVAGIPAIACVTAIACVHAVAGVPLALNVFIVAGLPIAGVPGVVCVPDVAFVTAIASVPAVDNVSAVAPLLILTSLLYMVSLCAPLYDETYCIRLSDYGLWTDIFLLSDYRNIEYWTGELEKLSELYIWSWPQTIGLSPIKKVYFYWSYVPLLCHIRNDNFTNRFGISIYLMYNP